MGCRILKIISGENELYLVYLLDEFNGFPEELAKYNLIEISKRFDYCLLIAGSANVI